MSRECETALCQRLAVSCSIGLRPLITPKCLFVNLPETHRSRWGEGLTAEDMKKCVWVRPELVARVEFLEWTESDHLRHSKFVGLREDKDARAAVKEHGGEF
jgi:bifunctional non-homologous end joining protein LigD